MQHHEAFLLVGALVGAIGLLDDGDVLRHHLDLDRRERRGHDVVRRRRERSKDVHGRAAGSHEQELRRDGQRLIRRLSHLIGEISDLRLHFVFREAAFVGCRIGGREVGRQEGGIAVVEGGTGIGGQVAGLRRVRHQQFQGIEDGNLVGQSSRRRCERRGHMGEAFKSPHLLVADRKRDGCLEALSLGDDIGRPDEPVALARTVVRVGVLILHAGCIFRRLDHRGLSIESRVDGFYF